MTAVRSVERPLLDATSRWRFFVTAKNAVDAVSTQKGKKGLSLRLCPDANLKTAESPRKVSKQYSPDCGSAIPAAPSPLDKWGLAFVPETMAYDALDNGSIVKIALAEAAPCRHVTLVTDPQKPLSKAIRLMREMAMAVE